MKTMSRLLWRSVYFLLLAFPAHAGTIVVPPLVSGPHTHPVCVAVLVRRGGIARTALRSVHVELFDASGAALSQATCANLLGGHSCIATAARNSGPVYCRVKVRGDRKLVRASLIMADDTGKPKSAIAWHQES